MLALQAGEPEFRSSEQAGEVARLLSQHSGDANRTSEADWPASPANTREFQG